MKRSICLLLVMIMVLSISACGETAASAPSDAEKGAILCYQYIKDNLKNSDSLQLKSISAVESSGTNWYYKIEFSAMNGFGGYTTDTWYMKATPGSVDVDDYWGADTHTNLELYNEYLKEGHPTPEINIETVEAGLH